MNFHISSMNFHNFQFTTSLSTFVSVLILIVQEMSLFLDIEENTPFACCQESWQILYLELHTKGPLRQITSCGCVVDFRSLPFWSKWECIGGGIRYREQFLVVWILSHNEIEYFDTKDMQFDSKHSIAKVISIQPFPTNVPFFLYFWYISL